MPDVSCSVIEAHIFCFKIFEDFVEVFAGWRKSLQRRDRTQDKTKIRLDGERTETVI